jgi:hypothetical protein
VKTLSDPARKDVAFSPHAIRINALRKKASPSSLSTDTPRHDGIEEQVYRVRAQVVTATIEDDSDIHLVIATRGHRHFGTARSVVERRSEFSRGGGVTR